MSDECCSCVARCQMNVAHVLLDIRWLNVAYVLLGDRRQEGGESHEAGV